MIQLLILTAYAQHGNTSNYVEQTEARQQLERKFAVPSLDTFQSSSQTADPHKALPASIRAVVTGLEFFVAQASRKAPAAMAVSVDDMTGRSRYLDLWIVLISLRTRTMRVRPHRLSGAAS